jgi:hypothetical protein
MWEVRRRRVLFVHQGKEHRRGRFRDKDQELEIKLPSLLQIARTEYHISE